MPFTSLWVSGNSVRAERIGIGPGSLENVEGDPFGWGVAFRGRENERWFHIPLPTAVILPLPARQPYFGKRLSLSRVFVLYLTEGNVRPQEINLWDGPNGPLRINLRDIFPAAPSSSFRQDLFSRVGVRNLNTWDINPRKRMQFGLVISVRVSFGEALSDVTPTITFGTAGAEFEPESGEDLLGPGTQPLSP